MDVQCFGLLGVNGAGKTTTFNIITGEIPQTGGELLYANKRFVLASLSALITALKSSTFSCYIRYHLTIGGVQQQQRLIVLLQ
jgi:ABC-type multidrug transport system ATPase subunit